MLPGLFLVTLTTSQGILRKKVALKDLKALLKTFDPSSLKVIYMIYNTRVIACLGEEDDGITMSNVVWIEHYLMELGQNSTLWEDVNISDLKAPITDPWSPILSPCERKRKASSDMTAL